MPYMIVPQGNDFCIYKKGADGNPVGDMIASHPTRKKAIKHMRAMMAAESSQKSLPNTIGNILQANIHESFTETADLLALMGYVNIQQRIAMSNVIGDVLGGLPASLKDINNILVSADDVDVLVAEEEEDEGDADPDEGDGGGDDMMGGMSMMGDDDMPEMWKTHMQTIGGKRVDRDALPDSAFVFPDERVFPIVNKLSVTAAVHRWGTYKGKHSFESFKKNLTALAKRLGYTSALPQSWDAEKATAMAEAILFTAAKSLYDSSSDYVWAGVSHNAWKDDIDDIIPLSLILADIDFQKSQILRGRASQYGEGLWKDHNSKSVIGTCLVREVMEGGRSCIEGGQLKPGNDRLNGVQMSIGYKSVMMGDEYLLVYVNERSALETTRRINGRTFFSVKHKGLLQDSVVKSIAEDISAYLLGGK